MDKIDKIIQSMEEIYNDFNSGNMNNVKIEDLQKLRDFSKNYSLDIQEFIYDLKKRRD